MELTNTNVDDFFEPTPKLKSSPIPIKFLSFNQNDDNCFYCRNFYTKTYLFKQKYCENCLLQYINYLIDNYKYLDVLTTNKDNASCLCAQCIPYFKILYFKQVVGTYSFKDRHTFNVKEQIKTFDIEKDCRLCGQQIYECSLKFSNFKICPDCYLISCGWVESTLTEVPIQVLYLPWWDTHDQCINCFRDLKFVLDCQKWCPRCNIIYAGCRYCLTTNIIFGLTDKSQCRKCSRILYITIISEGSRINIKIPNNIKLDVSNPLNIYGFIKFNEPSKSLQIPYSEIKIHKEIAQGGFGIIYEAIWSNNSYEKKVAIKKFLDSQNISKSFLIELNSYCQLSSSDGIIRCYGFTKDPNTKEYMLVMDYASGDLRQYLQKNFTNITWKEKLDILQEVLHGLAIIHKANFIHRDFHSGNILIVHDQLNSPGKWKIGDFGLSQHTNNTSLKNEIYGVIPYVAPEIFKGARFSKASDIYSVGMIMWELTTGCKPFANVEHDISLIYNIIDGKRPDITIDTPECFAYLVKRCWDSDPSKRPSISKINKTINDFLMRDFDVNIVDYEKPFRQAEEKRFKLIKSKKLGPDSLEFTEKPHSKAIYTSRPLRSLISKSSSINTSSIVLFNNKPEYTSKECDFDIQSSFSQNINSSIQNSSNTQHPGAIYTSRSLKFKSSPNEYISKEYELDINDVQSSSSSKAKQDSLDTQCSTIYTSKPSTCKIKKRNIKELNIESQGSRKHTKCK